MNIEDLFAEREIQRQLIAFARAMDNRDWEAIEAITSEDIRADFGLGEIQGRSSLIELIRSFLDNCGETQHLLGNFVIEVTGDTATSEAYVSDMHLDKDNSDSVSFRTLGNYSDTWEKVDGAWIMTRRIKDNRATIGSMEVFK